MKVLTNYTLFFGKGDFLSNFHPCPFLYLGKVYLSVEHFYICQKLVTLGHTLEKINAILDNDPFLKSLQQGKLSKEEVLINPIYLNWFNDFMINIKHLGRSTKGNIQAWDSVKDKIMELGLSLKFNDPHLKQQLLDTKDTILVECSPYDHIWGIGYSIEEMENHINQFNLNNISLGQNKLGGMLMNLRQKLYYSTKEMKYYD